MSTELPELSHIDALKALRDMQAQIIHGSTVFGDIANALEQKINELETEIERRDSAAEDKRFN